ERALSVAAGGGLGCEGFEPRGVQRGKQLRPTQQLHGLLRNHRTLPTIATLVLTGRGETAISCGEQLRNTSVRAEPEERGRLRTSGSGFARALPPGRPGRAP